MALFWALVQRTPRFEARALLHLIDGVAEGAGSLFTEGSIESRLTKDKLRRIAYPLKRKGPRFAFEQDPADDES